MGSTTLKGKVIQMRTKERRKKHETWNGSGENKVSEIVVKNMKMGYHIYNCMGLVYFCNFKNNIIFVLSLFLYSCPTPYHHYDITRHILLWFFFLQQRSIVDGLIVVRQDPPPQKKKIK